MATHTRILTWEIPWTEEPGGLQSLGSQRVGYNLVAKQQEVVFNCLATFFFFHFRKSKLALLIGSRMRQHPIQQAEWCSEVLHKKMVFIGRKLCGSRRLLAKEKKGLLQDSSSSFGGTENSRSFVLLESENASGLKFHSQERWKLQLDWVLSLGGAYHE